MIELYGRRSSSNVQRVIWALEEMGVPYARHTIGGSFGGGEAADYRAMNPTGLIPTLKDDDRVIWESEAILRYVAARYGAGGLWPEAAADRALGDQWLAWTAAVLAPAFGAVFFKTIRAPKAAHDLAALGPQIDALCAAMRVLDVGLSDGRAHIGGVRFSYADIPIGIISYRYGLLPIERPDLPHLAGWYARIAARPAFQAHVALPIGTCFEEWLAHEQALR